MICTICKTEEVTSTNPDVDFCRTCHYCGFALERQHSEFLDELRHATDWSNIAVWHTGGGCFVLLVPLTLNPMADPEDTPGTFITLVEAVQDPRGVWIGEPGLPEPGPDQLWHAYLWDEPSWMGEKDPLDAGVPLTRDEAVAWVREKARVAA